ncbi:MAG TPA: PAS domain-containing protein, partial [Bryobacteraceae bacterium]|nr:PAS domain-containing protein [Bryobacteraceae bacterium]
MASVIPDSDFRLLFELSPTLYLVLLPDAPRFTIAGVSDSYLAATLTERAQILGRGVFEVFPDNPSDAAATGVSNLKASLERVLATGRADTMAVQKYDIRKPESEGNEFEERHWSPVNSPVSSDGTLLYILHRAEDVTDFVRAREKGVAQAELTEHLRIRNEQIESEIFIRAQQLQESNRQLRLANHDLALLREQESARAREELSRSERRYRTLVSATTSIVWTRSPAGAFDEPQPSWAAFTGQAFEEYCGWGWLSAIHPEDRARVETHWRAALRGEEYPDIEARIFHAATQKYHYFVERAVPVRNPNGAVEEWIGTVTEIEGRRRLEEQLRHTAKLESLGILAGGIAHDFNNLLTGVLGNASQALEVLLLRNAGERALIENVMSAAERAAHLTRQMLAYAGKGTFALTNVNLSELVRGMSALVQTSVPKSVHLQLNLQDNLPLIEGDVGQLQQVVMNLIINGAEAIPSDRPGTVLATTSVQDVDEEYAANFSPGAALTPGRYVVLEV